MQEIKDNNGRHRPMSPPGRLQVPNSQIQSIRPGGGEHVMSDLIQLTKDGEIAIITINNPPVNAISPGVPEGISEAIDQINKDSAVTAAVVIVGGRTFIAGGDIKKFTKMTSGTQKTGPGLLPLLLKIENSAKPVVMAIHGTAFGGGLEVAMSGH